PLPGHYLHHTNRDQPAGGDHAHRASGPDGPGRQLHGHPAGGTIDTVGERTADFLNRENAQVAINASFFWPSPLAVGGSANLVGFAASQGNVISPFEPQPVSPTGGYPDQSYAILPYAPALNIDASNHAGIVHRDPAFADNKHIQESATLWNTVSGSAQIVTNGNKTIPTYSGTANGGLNLLNGYSDSNSWYAKAINARTSIGLSADGNTLTLFTVDKAGGSAGMTVSEVADMLINNYGVYNALNLDGGGSTSMALQDPTTHVGSLVNASSDNSLGRIVGSNLAVFAVPEPATLAMLGSAMLTLLALKGRNQKTAAVWLVAVISAAILGFGASGQACAAAITQPYTQDFQSYSDGSSLANENIGGIGTVTTNTWLTAHSGTNEFYQNTLVGSSAKGLDSLQVSNLGPATSANDFEVKVTLLPPGTVTAGTNVTEGVRFLASTSNTVNDAYAVDLNIGTTNPGRLRLVEWTGSTAVVYPDSAQANQPLVPNFSTSKSYLLDVTGTYDSLNRLSITATVTEVGAPANTVSSSFTSGASGALSPDASPRTGTYFGFYASFSGAATEVANFDNFSVVPEPATIGLLACGMTSLLMRRRQK
ncbi:MAG: phosphodiester glycosidase family protein, partial [Planctomycetota bacterium]|nr:phosphodiester glycosidase family protein [Planctomycetota bacterium]